MINLQNLQNLVAANPPVITTDDFIKIHKGVEGYIRRLLFIGLRLNGVKYETASEVINMSYLNNRELLKKTVELVTRNTNTLTGFENHNSDFKEIINLFFDFTSIYRNRVIHGVYENINDQTILKHCYYIDKYLIEEFEYTLNSLGYNSAFDQPNAWGAIRATGTETFNQVITRLRLGRLTRAPKGIISVQNLIATTKYNGRI
jgi:hypothetical protein